MNLKETIRRLLREDDYSPAGKEIIPNKIVVHKSNPMFRDNILKDGLKAKSGECYRIYVGYGTKCKPAIFATDSTNKRAWFDSTYDDDIWEINTEMIPDVMWYKDRHYETRSKHIVTFQDIPSDALTLKYKGKSIGESTLQESIKRILREETNNLTLQENYTPWVKRRMDMVRKAERGASHYMMRIFKHRVEKSGRFNKEDFIHTYFSVMMDDLHGHLSNWGSEDFDYDGILNQLKESFTEHAEELWKHLNK